jgi:hypothetical protein
MIPCLPRCVCVDEFTNACSRLLTLRAVAKLGGQKWFVFRVEEQPMFASTNYIVRLSTQYENDVKTVAIPVPYESKYAWSMHILIPIQ